MIYRWIDNENPQLFHVYTKRFYVATKQTISPIFKPLTQMVQMIYCWIDDEILQLFHALSFSNSAQFFNNFENTKIRTIKKQENSNFNEVFQPSVRIF
jgi:hypothetical protein